MTDMNREIGITKPGMTAKVDDPLAGGIGEVFVDALKRQAASPSDMADAHWSYVNSVLVAHGVPDGHREVAKHHYIAAFIHGFKHGAAR